jgi:hypothetical protein
MRACLDEPNLVALAGLAPVLDLARRAGLHELVESRCTGAEAPGFGERALKVRALVAGMVTDTDCIDDMDLLRRGMPIAFTGIRAPSTLGTFLRTLGLGHVRQLDAVAARADAVVTSPRTRLRGATNAVVSVPELNQHSELPASAAAPAGGGAGPRRHGSQLPDPGRRPGRRGRGPRHRRRRGRCRPGPGRLGPLRHRPVPLLRLADLAAEAVEGLAHHVGHALGGVGVGQAPAVDHQAELLHAGVAWEPHHRPAWSLSSRFSLAFAGFLGR